MTDLFDTAVAAKLAGGSGGGEAVLKTKTVTANGVYNASSDHADGYSKVTVNVPSPPAPVLISKNIGANGTYAASGDNADGYSAVTVEVPAPEPPVLTTKSITENGTYNAAGDNADGYSAVTVNVPQRAAAAGGLIISSDALKLSPTMDSADPFEVVMCVRIDPDDVPALPEYEWIVGCFEGAKQAFYLQMYKNDGHIVVNTPFLWGTHDWTEGNYDEIFLTNAEEVLNCDGEAWNYLKIIKTADLKYQLWYSTDGTAYTLADETQLPNNMTNLNTFTPIIPVPAGMASNHRWNLQDICLPNCYFKQNGTVVWGREIG